MATHARLSWVLLGLASVASPCGYGAIAQDPPASGAQDAPPDAPKPKRQAFSTRRLGPQTQRTSRPDEKAILDGMRWLIRHQNADGSWSASGIGARCRTNPPCIARVPGVPAVGDVGVTSLALAGFLGAGFSPASKQDIVDIVMAERHKIGKVIGAGVEWLVEQQSADGTWPVSTCGLENQSLATLVLSEALGLCGDPALQAPAQKAVDALQRAQQSDAATGRWGWKPCATPSPAATAEPADLAATAWAVQALVAAREAGLVVDEAALGGAMAFGDDAWKTIAQTGAADARVLPLALMRILVRPFASDPVLQHIRGALPADGRAVAALDGPTAFDQSFVMVQVHGETSTIRDPKLWDRWNDEVPRAITALQERAAESCRSGGWLEPDPGLVDAGPATWTAFRMLALENPYRYESKFSAPKPK